MLRRGLKVLQNNGQIPCQDLTESWHVDAPHPSKKVLEHDRELRDIPSTVLRCSEVHSVDGARGKSEILCREICLKTKNVSLMLQWHSCPLWVYLNFWPQLYIVLHLQAKFILPFYTWPFFYILFSSPCVKCCKNTRFPAIYLTSVPNLGSVVVCGGRTSIDLMSAGCFSHSFSSCFLFSSGAVTEDVIVAGTNNSLDLRIKHTHRKFVHLSCYYYYEWLKK